MWRRFLLPALLSLCVSAPFAQAKQAEGTHVAPAYPVFETDKLPISQYAARREALKAQLGKKGVGIFFTNPERNRNNDVDFRFRGDSNFLYLTGFEEPDAALILVPGGVEIDGKMATEILFVNESDPQSETWLGYRMGPENAMKLLGVGLALPNRRFGDVLQTIAAKDDFEVARPVVPPDPSGTVGKMASTANDWRKTMPESSVNLQRALAKMRVVKSKEEIALIRHAAEASTVGHREAMRSVHPGMWEYDIQAIVEYCFARNGCEFVAYPSIVGSGMNGCILHYEADRKRMKDGELICMDVAGEYHGYAADVTRTFPVNGKFTPEQKAIYNLVLKAQTAGIRECKNGAPFNAAHRAASKILSDGLIALGIIGNSSQLGTYFPHGTSHYVGLDVHDSAGDTVLHSGAVLTVEPGLYIKAGSPCDKKWWNIGVRIEDDILVTDGEPIILSAGAPRQIEDIERLMRQRGVGDFRLSSQ